MEFIAVLGVALLSVIMLVSGIVIMHRAISYDKAPMWQRVIVFIIGSFGLLIYGGVVSTIYTM